MKVLKKEILVSHKELINKRLDIAMSTLLKELSRSKVQSLVKKGLITVNDKIVKTGYPLQPGDEIKIFGMLPKDKPLNVDIDILFEDKDLIVINKPAGIIVHPSKSGAGSLSVAELLKAKIQPSVGEKGREGVVHRLDKNTSGALILARTSLAYSSLVDQFFNRSIKKYYSCLVKGQLEPDEGVIDSPISRHKIHRKKMSLSLEKEGRRAITKYKVKSEYELSKDSFVSLVEVNILTGRTHQIRVHFQGLKHPVVGDETYGIRSFNDNFKKLFGLQRQFLHAEKVSFMHPRSQKPITVKAPLPEDLSGVVSKLKTFKT